MQPQDTHSDDELPADIQWAIGTVADLQLETKALREDAQRTHDGSVRQYVQELTNHVLACGAILRALQAHVGKPKPPRLPVWDQPTTILGPLWPPPRGDVPIDDTGEPPTPPRRPR